MVGPSKEGDFSFFYFKLAGYGVEQISKVLGLLEGLDEAISLENSLIIKQEWNTETCRYKLFFIGQILWTCQSNFSQIFGHVNLFIGQKFC